MHKQEFLERMRQGRAELEQTFAGLTPEQAVQPSAGGAWSPKDVLAHITWHEGEMIGVIEGMALVGSEWWGLPTDERNARIFEANRERTWQDVLAEAQQVYPRLLQALEGLEGVAGIELGLPPQADSSVCRSLVQAALGELPVIARLPFETALILAERLADSGAAAFSLSAPRGMLKAPGGDMVSGRLYGPAVFPQALALAAQLSQPGLPVIGAGGVRRRADVDAMLAAGALAVQLDSVLWLGGFED